MTNELHSIQVDFSGLMEVLGKNLYSTPVVAVRELVQNAHDSCIRRRLELDPEHVGEIRLKTKPGILIIEDEGSGLTHDEILQYLSTIGVGYTRELRASHPSEDLIGAFGLGFLTAYVVSTRVEVTTRSVHEPEQTWRFVSRGGEQFTLQDADALEYVGTRVTLEVKEGFEALQDPERLGWILDRYCGLLTVPIFLQGRPQAINAEPPPWRLARDVASSVLGRKARIRFASRFETRAEPIATIDVPPSADDDIQGGLLWIQDTRSYATSDQRHVSVFVRNMLVSNDERDLLPPWAGFVGGVLASTGLTPTASRETLMKDEAYERATRHLTETLIEGLERLARVEPASWRRTLRRHRYALLGAAISDDRLFSLLCDELTVPTSEGDMTMPEVLESGPQVHISTIEGRGVEEVLFRALQRPILTGWLYAVYPFARLYTDRKVLTLIELGTRSGHDALFAPTELAVSSRRKLRAWFERDGAKLVWTRFAPGSLPVILSYDQDVKLKRRVEAEEVDKRIGSAVLSLARMYTQEIDDTTESTLYLNLDAPILGAMLEREVEDPGARAVARMLWNMATLMAPAADVSAEIEGTLQDINETLAMFLGEPQGG